MSRPAAYDEIGLGYGAFRKPDLRIARMIDAALGDARTILDVGAGTGSYEPAGREVVAIEPSPVMISQRAQNAPPVVRAAAESLPFRDQTFDAAMAVLTAHHWADPVAGLTEMRRVAKRQVVLTFDPEITNRFWLITDYIPSAGTIAASTALPLSTVVETLDASLVQPVLVPHDCVDGFGWAYWRRPEKYLDPRVRSCISMLAQSDPSRVEEGIRRLSSDLVSGEWTRRYRSLLQQDSVDGGYRIVVASEAG
ncbi:MAG: methyltransferase domain-containing protein [Mycobacterium sp.]|nr:methyltransferase domain-containing protein [Mycobacterium sp.]MBV8292154.1 methyltransferase domain-containing protein [Mycobacterium sp.]